MHPFEIVILVCIFVPVGLAFFFIYDESQRQDRAWDTIAEMRLHLDLLYVNTGRALDIVLDEIGIELDYPQDAPNMPRDYYISKFKPPHPDAD